MTHFGPQVMILKDKDFNSKGESIGSGKSAIKNGLVLLFASWCGHCISLAPKYDDAARMVSGFYTFAAIEDVNAAKYKETMKIRGFPSIFIYKNGKSIGEYQGPREVDGLVEEAKKLSEA